MPEGLEVEIYRRSALALLGRVVRSVEIDERRVDPELVRALPGHTVTSVSRLGKMLMFGTDGPSVGIHFGMTGRIIVDGHAPIDRLEYGSKRDDPAWDRLVIRFDRGAMRVNDPRRWCRVVLDPDTARLGPDLFGVTLAHLAERCARRSASVKSVLLDQTVIAGLGNMCVDEVLYHAHVAPDRSANGLDPNELARIHRAMGAHLPQMLERGGSHTGTLDPAIRRLLPPCPLDGEPLAKTVIGGRSTVWCKRHQR